MFRDHCYFGQESEKIDLDFANGGLESTQEQNNHLPRTMLYKNPPKERPPSFIGVVLVEARNPNIRKMQFLLGGSFVFQKQTLLFKGVVHSTRLDGEFSIAISQTNSDMKVKKLHFQLLQLDRNSTLFSWRFVDHPTTMQKSDHHAYKHLTSMQASDHCTEIRPLYMHPTTTQASPNHTET